MTNDKLWEAFAAWFYREWKNVGDIRGDIGAAAWSAWQACHAAMQGENVVRDAARWRYIRREVVSASWVVNGGLQIKTLENLWNPIAFDQAIDAAMGERHG